MRFHIGITLSVAALLVLVAATPTGHDAIMRESEGDRVFVLVRHAEKCLAQGSDPMLSEEGRQRSDALARMLSDAPLDAIYSTPFHRTVQTAEPTAQQHGLEIIETPVSSDFLSVLAERLRAADEKYVLVSGHSNTTPALANLLAGTDLEDMPDELYDLMYIVTLGSDGSSTVLPLRYGSESGTEPGC